MIRFIYNKGKYEHIRELLRSSKVLNVCRKEVLNKAIFMHRVKANITSNAVLSRYHNSVILIQEDSLA